MELSGRIVAVTGATGFLGSHIALDLLARGARVRAVVRNPDKARWLVEKGVEIAKADLMDRAALAEGFRGVDAVVSNAALYTLAPKSWREYRETNETGTRNAMDAAADAGVKRVVDISTCGVYRPMPFKWIREDAPRLRAWDRFWMLWPYPASKALAEDVAWERAAARVLDLTVLRPAGIFGPRDTQAVPTIRRFVHLPILLPVPTLVFPFSHGRDVAGGVSGALVNDASIGKAYNLAGDPISLYTLLKTWRKVEGRAIVVPLPMLGGLWFDNEAAKRDLGFTNRPLEDAIRDTVHATVAASPAGASGGAP